MLLVLGFGSRDAAATGDYRTRFLLLFFFLYLFFSRFQTDDGGSSGVGGEVANLTGTCIRDLLPEIRVEVV